MGHAGLQVCVKSMDALNSKDIINKIEGSAPTIFYFILAPSLADKHHCNQYVVWVNTYRPIDIFLVG